ncbi:MAG: ATPase AAA [Candidatus Sericytochromatia bacterium]|nr:MAG: ATPase AAA [Candidatus Sericytochromatia bacterium]
MSNIDDLEILIRARYPIIYIVSYEERRVENDILNISLRSDKKTYSWSSTQGLINVSQSKNYSILNESSKDIYTCLDIISKSNEASIFILKDLHHYINDPLINRKIKDLSISLKSTFKTIIILSPILKIPTELEKDIVVIDYKLSDFNDIAQLLDKLINSLQINKKNVEINLSTSDKERLIQSCLGLTLSEVENVLAKIIVSKKRLDIQDIDLINEEKKQIIRKTGLLEFYSTSENISNVGGLNNLKIWLKKRSRAFTKEARNYGLPQPKGILLLGVSGSGKSLVAKSISSLWHLPLLRLDMGNLFSGLVGSSEENVRKSIKIAESVAPCLLWLDEIDKSFSGMSNSQISDGGTSARVLSSFLTWMQEKQSSVFIIATANDISNMPPELLRKGRFDEIFFLDLPTLNERKEIFNIHLLKRNRNPINFDIQYFAEISEGFSGAEIEQVIISAMYDSFEENREVSNNDIINSIKNCVPLSKTMKEAIENIRNWSKTRAIPAS